MLHQAFAAKGHAVTASSHGACNHLGRYFIHTIGTALDETRIAKDDAVDVAGIGIIGAAPPPAAEIEGIPLAAAELAKMPAEEVGIGASIPTCMLCQGCLVTGVLVVALDDAHGCDGEVHDDEKPLEWCHLHFGKLFCTFNRSGQASQQDMKTKTG